MSWRSRCRHRVPRAITVCLAVAVLIATGDERSFAQRGRQRSEAVTRLDQVDADFWIQGEYAGSICRSGYRIGLGLQVRALGDGRFSGLVYEGGLPGNGGRTVNGGLQGERRADGVHLVGDGWEADLEAGRAHLRDTSASGLAATLIRQQRYSRTLGRRPPRGALVLFDGGPNVRFEDPVITEEGTLMAGALTTMPLGDMQLHLEFRTPYMPAAQGQARGNSGVYIQRRYEVQILDSFGLVPQTNDCGALYRQQAPSLNMSFPPLSWQTYDIYFSAARWTDDGTKTRNAQITVLHNGVPIHQRYELIGKTGAGRPEDPELRPLYLQDHGNPVHFRNIWIAVPGSGEACRPTLFRRAGGLGLFRRSR